MASGGQWTPRAAARELRLPPAADEALVKKRYRELAKQLHPDRNKGNEAAATEAFQDHEMQTFLESMLSHCRIGDHAVVEHVNNFLARFRPAEGATASLSLAITIAYHHVATGRRVLAERTSMPITIGKKLYKIGMGLACLSVEIRAFRFARPETFSAQVWALLKRKHNKDAPMGNDLARLEGEQRQLEAERRILLDQHARDVAATAPTAAHGAQGQYLLGEARKHNVTERERAEYSGGGPKVHIDKNWGRIG